MTGTQTIKPTNK